jgi:bifunctional non-homologous end joining protein LigD
MAFQRKKPAAVGFKAPYPGFVEPALARSVDKVPAGERWVHEIKFDGYRVQVHLRDAAVKVFTRRGHDWTNRFGKIASDAWHIAAGSAIVDGEVVVPTQDGSTDFSVLQNELKGRSSKIVLVAFDLLYLNGYDRCGVRRSFHQCAVGGLCHRRDGLVRQRDQPPGAGIGADGQRGGRSGAQDQ